MKISQGKSGADLNYPFQEAPVLGEMISLVPSVRWIRLPVIGELGHINVWAIADGEGWTIVDCGLFTPETIEAWEKLLVQGLDGHPVKRVIVTHMHVDHIGMAGWLTRRFNCSLWITALEYQGCADSLKGVDLDQGVAFYRKAGWSDEMLAEYCEQANDLIRYVDTLPLQFRALIENEQLKIGEYIWEVVTGRGHSPHHACLWCKELGLFISGDQVLPTISSNISVVPTNPSNDPLGHWLDSIEKLKNYIPDSVLVLPAHGLPFNGLHSRLAQLAVGHKNGLQRLRNVLDQPARVIDLFSVLFRYRKEYSVWLSQLATGECIAHLNRLLAQDDIEVIQDSEGVNWYINRLKGQISK